VLNGLAPNAASQAHAMRRARLIMNPISGDDEPNPMKLPDIVAAMEAKIFEPTWHLLVTCSNCNDAVEEGYDMVVVGGGDGTERSC